MRQSFLLLLSLLFISWNASAQEKTTVNYDLYVEDIMHNHNYQTDGLRLERANFRKPKVKDSVRFRRLLDCGFNLSLRENRPEAMPEELKAFGHDFSLLNREKNEVRYFTEEKDSEIHYINFKYTEFRKNKALEKVVISSKNTRSGKIIKKYVYVFRPRR